MILSLYLTHLKTRGRHENFDIFNIPASDIALIMQMPGRSHQFKQKLLEEYVQKQVVAKLPASLNNFQVESWELLDHHNNHDNILRAPNGAQYWQRNNQPKPERGATFFRGARVA